MGYTFSYDGIDLETAYGWELVSVQRQLLSRIRQSVTDYGMADGAAVLGGYRDATVITAVILIAGSGYTSVEAGLDTLRHVLDSHQERKLLFGQWPDRYWMGKLDGDVDWEELEGAGAIATLRFICSKPFAYASSLSSLPFTIDTDPKSFQVADTEVENSSADPDPVFIAHLTAPMTSLTLNNTTTGESLTFATALASGMYIKFDTANALTYTSADGSTWTLSLQRKTGSYPRLARRADNDFTISGFTGTLTVQFRETFRS